MDIDDYSSWDIDSRNCKYSYASHRKCRYEQLNSISILDKIPSGSISSFRTVSFFILRLCSISEKICRTNSFFTKYYFYWTRSISTLYGRWNTSESIHGKIRWVYRRANYRISIKLQVLQAK